MQAVRAAYVLAIPVNYVPCLPWKVNRPNQTNQKSAPESAQKCPPHPHNPVLMNIFPVWTDQPPPVSLKVEMSSATGGAAMNFHPGFIANPRYRFNADKCNLSDKQTCKTGVYQHKETCFKTGRNRFLQQKKETSDLVTTLVQVYYDPIRLPEAG